MHNLVISAFPGAGKSWLAQNPGNLRITDSDSSGFSWTNQAENIRHPEWPQNYMRHILEQIRISDIVFVSTHKDVRDAMLKAMIPFILVYPSLDMKQEYIQRYIDRGNASAFVALLEQNYELWIAELEAQECYMRVVLKPGQYLADIMPLMF
jgi:hypothetical protein